MTVAVCVGDQEAVAPDGEECGRPAVAGEMDGHVCCRDGASGGARGER